MGRKKKTDPYQHLNEITKRFLDLISTTLAPKTSINYRSNLFAFIRFLNASYPKITRFSQLKRSPHIEKWLTHLAATYSRNGTRRIHIIKVRRFLNDIYDWGWDNTPQEQLFVSKDLPSGPQYLPKPITPEADKKLKETLNNENNLLSLGIFLLRNSGMRVGELQDLEVNCVQKLPDGQYLLHVPLGKLKTERIIPVDEETADIVKRIIDMRELLLPLPNPKTAKPTEFLLLKKNWTRPSYSGLRAALKRSVINSGINNHITLHQLRHTYATELLRGGMRLPVLMKLLGHTSIAMTIRYTGVSQPDLQKAYYAALRKSRSLDLIPKSADDIFPEPDLINEPDYIFDGIKSLITKLSCLGRDIKDKKSQKKLQRIRERLRKVSKDIDDTIKT